MKRLNQISCYKIDTSKHHYIVTLERLNNTSSGTPRFKAIIMIYSDSGVVNSLYNAVYTFNGHYMNELGECEWIVNQFEGGLDK